MLWLPLRIDVSLALRPWANWAILGATAAAFLGQRFAPEWSDRYCLASRDPRLGDLVTYAFLHLNLLHLGGQSPGAGHLRQPSQRTARARRLSGLLPRRGRRCRSRVRRLQPRRRGRRRQRRDGRRHGRLPRPSPAFAPDAAGRPLHHSGARPRVHPGLFPAQRDDGPAGGADGGVRRPSCGPGVRLWPVPASGAGRVAPQARLRMINAPTSPAFRSSASA